MDNKLIIKQLLVVILISLCLLPRSTHAQNQREIDVRASVTVKTIAYKAYPEKRIPSVNNWGTISKVELLDCLTQNTLYTFLSINSNSSGIGQIHIEEGVPGGSYILAVKGASHLRQISNCNLFLSQYAFVDLTIDQLFLRAGSISVIPDNYINSFDILEIIKNANTNYYFSDLNLDGKVNSIDMSILLSNLYQHGQ